MKRGCQKTAKCEISAESDNFIYCPNFYSRGNRNICLSQEEKFQKFFFCKMEFWNEKGMPKKAKCEISAESDNFIFRLNFYSRVNRHICQRQTIFKFGNEKGMSKKAKCEIWAESDNFIFCPNFYSRLNRHKCHRQKIFKFGNEKGMSKKGWKWNFSWIRYLYISSKFLFQRKSPYMSQAENF